MRRYLSFLGWWWWWSFFPSSSLPSFFKIVGLFGKKSFWQAEENEGGKKKKKKNRTRRRSLGWKVDFLHSLEVIKNKVCKYAFGHFGENFKRNNSVLSLFSLFAHWSWHYQQVLFFPLFSLLIPSFFKSIPPPTHDFLSSSPQIQVVYNSFILICFLGRKGFFFVCECQGW